MYMYVYIYIYIYIYIYGAWGGVVVKALRYYSNRAGIDSVTYSFRPYHGPGVDSAPSENEYQEHFLGVKVAGA